MSARSTIFCNGLWGIGTVVCVFVCASPTLAQESKKRPSIKQVSGITQAKLAEREGYQPGDLITQTDVKRVLLALNSSGWQPTDSKQLLADSLPENAVLARTLKTKKGARFMRKVGDYELIFDRMDRVSRVSGGSKMLTDIAKLPDGEKLAKLNRPNGVPGFLDLLPKKSSGKVRSIKDYEQPTGRIYTEKQLLQRLKESYQGKPKGNAR